MEVRVSDDWRAVFGKKPFLAHWQRAILGRSPTPPPHDHSGYGVESGENEVASATWQPCNARVGKSMLGEKVRSSSILLHSDSVCNNMCINLLIYTVNDI